MNSDKAPGRRGIRESIDSDDFLLEFDNPSEDFMRGFECGEIWACLADGVDYLHTIVIASNALMIMRMVDAAKRKFDINYSFDACELTQEQVDQLELGPGEWMSVVMRADYEGQEG